MFFVLLLLVVDDIRLVLLIEYVSLCDFYCWFYSIPNGLLITLLFCYSLAVLTDDNIFLFVIVVVFLIKGYLFSYTSTSFLYGSVRNDVNGNFPLTVLTTTTNDNSIYYLSILSISHFGILKLV